MESKETKKLDNLLSKVTRVEVIDALGRSYVKRDDNMKVTAQLQDDNRTLKIFLSYYNSILEY